VFVLCMCGVFVLLCVDDIYVSCLSCACLVCVCLVSVRVSVWFVWYWSVCVMFVSCVWRGLCSFC